MDTRLFEDFGLTESEARVYLSLLDMGPSLAGKIASRTGIHRRNIYDILNRLSEKGIVGYIVSNNRKVFEAASPERFRDILKQKEIDFENMLPKLNNLYKKTKEKQETNFYKGREGLKTVFQDQLSDNKEVLILGASKAASEVLPFYFNWYDKERVSKKIKARIISSEKLDKIPLSQIKMLPQKYANPLAINIYKDKVALVLWTAEPIAIVIKNEEIAQSYRTYFELMWKIAR